MPHFFKELRFWSAHVTLTATPSFLAALNHYDSPGDMIAMLLGILTFIILYTSVTTSTPFQKLRPTFVGKALKLGTKIRMWISLITAPLLLSGTYIEEGFTSFTFFAPDYWIGFISILLIRYISPFGENPFSTYLIVLTEGFLISITLLFIAFIALLILQKKKNNAFYREKNLPPS